MKKFYTLLIMLLITLGIFGQVPDKMSYQAIIRNASGELLKTRNVGIQISILRGSATGTAVYIETHSQMTNENGLVSIEIGDGAPVTGTFSSIDWSNGLYFLKTETDPTGGTSYSIAGTSQILSVPYALYAKSAGNGFSGNYNDLTNKPSLAIVASSGNYYDLLNTPVLFNGSWANITGKPATLSGYGITDAMSTLHPANEITELVKQQWSTSYGWGNHADAGYLTGLTEAWKKNNGNLYYNTGNIGIGTDVPVNKLSVLGSADFSTSIKTPLILPLDAAGSALSITTNNVSNSNAGDISIISGSNNSPKNGYGRAGDISIIGGNFAAEFPTGATSSRAGSVYIKGGNTPNGGGGVGFPGNIVLNGGEGGPNARGGAITLQGGSGNTGGNINITAGAGVGAGQVHIQGGTSTTLNNVGNVTISGGNKSGGGYYGTIIFRTSEVQQAVIDNAGNFGIGKAPATKLDVNGVVTANEGNSDNWNTSFGWGNHALAGYAVLPVQTGNDGKVLSTDGNSTSWITPVTSSDLMSKVSKAGDNMTGQLTINNLTDRTALALNSGSHTELRIKGGASYIPTIFIGTSASSPNAEDAIIQFLDINYGSSSRLAFHMAPAFNVLNLLSNGNVGIGNSAPSTKLDVSGVITASGGNSANWNSAFGWGNHAAAGYSSTTHIHQDATNSVSGFMSTADKLKLDGLTPADGSETKVNAGANMEVAGTGTAADPYVVAAKPHTVGETYGGGVVFYVYDNGMHGLIAASADVSISGNSNLTLLYNGALRVAGAFANGLGAGKGNTSAIIAMQAAITPANPMLATMNAAYAAVNYSAQDANGVRYGDWYLPSQFEMVLMSNSTAAIPGYIRSNPYWSSTEVVDNINYAYMVVNGSLSVQDKRNSFRVRPIRAF